MNMRVPPMRHAFSLTARGRRAGCAGLERAEHDVGRHELREARGRDAARRPARGEHPVRREVDEVVALEPRPSAARAERPRLLRAPAAPLRATREARANTSRANLRMKLMARGPRRAATPIRRSRASAPPTASNSTESRTGPSRTRCKRAPVAGLADDGRSSRNRSRASRATSRSAFSRSRECADLQEHLLRDGRCACRLREHGSGARAPTASCAGTHRAAVPQCEPRRASCPVRTMSSAVAAAYERSIRRLSTNGPRSLTLTTTRLPFARFVTSTQVGNGSVVCAAVIACMLYVSPLEVERPWKSRPYHEATPRC